MEFKNRIRALRERQGLSAAQLAATFNKSEGAIRMWETGKTKPDADTLIKLSLLFGVSADYMLGLSDYQNLQEVCNQNEIADNVNFLKKDLEPKTYESFLKIEQNILHGYNFLAFEDNDLADEMISQLEFLTMTIMRHCEDAFAVFNTGYDSFDLNEISTLADEIDEKTKVDTHILKTLIQSLFEKIANSMIASLPETDETHGKASILDAIKQKQGSEVMLSRGEPGSRQPRNRRNDG